ncbi:type IV pilin protein [Aquicella lusitana]|uniref:Type IV pilus assembly protein PilE n=1 Tax=Aquicella lusitana TaxID=254246 RepID=A0A370GFF5_9COXI|nr:type IV pilin protein [Aquicella lusitana]RDI41839.1 type IV pilus assembly protein PilE [Aquicella lusitana]VVC73747.1 Fimbrial protein [Aquicella lusitana]
MPPHHGFNLLEILIVTCLIGILAALSIPLYSFPLTQEKRIEAAGVLSKLAVAMEQYYLEHQTYQGATLSALNLPDHIASGHYLLTIRIARDQDYLLEAKPLGKQAVNDAGCGTLILDSNGEKSVSGTEPVEACW